MANKTLDVDVVLDKVNKLLDLKDNVIRARCDYNATGSQIDRKRHDNAGDRFDEAYSTFLILLGKE
jgi:hypothetical protein